MAASIARGIEWRGHRVQQGRVTYIAAEGAGGFRKRLQAYAQHHDIQLDTLDIGIIPAAPNLLQKADALDVAKAIVASGGADVIIVDTFAQTTAGGNENSGEDVGKALAHCKGIHRATKATVILIHHSGKDSTKGARGWSGLRAAADAEIEVIRDNDARSLKLTKQKDGEDGVEYCFTLAPIVLGFDEDDDEVTSCVVLPSDVAPVRRKVVKLGPNEKTCVRVVKENQRLDGAPLTRTEIIDFLAAELIQDEKRDRRLEFAAKCVDKLIEKGILLEEDGGYVLAKSY